MVSNIQGKPGEGIAQVAVRLPVSLRDKLKNVAGERGQSVNTLIVMTMAKEAEQASEK